MSVHKDCGELVVWARRSDDPTRWMPPLEFVDNLIVIQVDENGERVAVNAPAYRVHDCDPDKVLAWMEYQEKLARLRERAPVQVAGMSAWEIARERNREQAWETALKVPCLRCGAKKGKKCIDLSLQRRNLKGYTKNPHAQRLEAGA